MRCLRTARGTAHSPRRAASAGTATTPGCACSAACDEARRDRGCRWVALALDGAARRPAAGTRRGGRRRSGVALGRRPPSASVGRVALDAAGGERRPIWARVGPGGALFTRGRHPRGRCSRRRPRMRAVPAGPPRARGSDSSAKPGAPPSGGRAARERGRLARDTPHRRAPRGDRAGPPPAKGKSAPAPRDRRRRTQTRRPRRPRARRPSLRPRGRPSRPIGPPTHPWVLQTRSAEGGTAFSELHGVFSGPTPSQTLELAAARRGARARRAGVRAGGPRRRPRRPGSSP